MLEVEEVGAERVGEEVEQAKYSGGDIGTPRPVVGRWPGCQLHDECDEVQGSGQTSVDQFLEEIEFIKWIGVIKLHCIESYRQNPMDGNGEHFTDAQQVDKSPEEGGNEGSHSYE